MSCLMKVIKGNKLIAWTVPTAGHILNDPARELCVARRDTGLLVLLNIALRSIHRFGRPIALLSKDPSLCNDCALPSQLS